ncbi:hypothetical protein ACTQV0_08165 [Selenomonas montiformis]|uniref:hypothetical protein n=1 Tax=Selenomonas montiformis TaxID=2652285 RepID=UPI003F88BBF2
MRIAEIRSSLSGINKVLSGLEEQHKLELREAEHSGYIRGCKDSVKPILPHPCDGPLYEDWDEGDYVMKVVEEVGEMAEAYRLYNLSRDDPAYDNLGRELVDVITACISTLEALDFNAADRERMYQEVNDSNAKRDDGRRFKHE